MHHRHLLFILLLACLRGILLHSSEEAVSVIRKNTSFFVVYHPYPELGSSSHIIKPLPLYSSWNIDRMDRDIARMQRIGVNGVLVSLDPSDLANPERVRLILQFMDLASLKSKDFRIAILLNPASPTRFDASNIASFLASRKIASHSSYFIVNKSNMVFYSDKASLLSNTAPGFSFISLPLTPQISVSPDGNSSLYEQISPVAFSDANLMESYSICRLFASYSENIKSFKRTSSVKWLIPRRKATAFASALKLTSAYDLAIISSWNDYGNLSAIENNTMDGSMMSDSLGKYIKSLGKGGEK